MEENEFKEKVQDAKEKVAEVIDKVEDKVEEVIDKVEDSVQEAFQKADDETADMAQNDIEKNKVFAVLAYLSILVLIPIFAAKDSKFARFHANQGLILLIISVLGSIIGKILHLGFIAWIINVLVFVFAVIGIVRVIKGQAKELPYIGNFTILK